MTGPGPADGVASAPVSASGAAEGAPLRVGILGVDWGGRVHVPAFRAVIGYEVVALCSTRESSAQLARQRTGIDDVSTDWQSFVGRDDLDVVSIATSVGTHRDILLAALDAGRNVACEKPLAPSLDGAAQMLAAAESSPGRSLVCFEMRWLPERLAIRDLVAAGAVGAPSFVQVTLTNNRWHRTRPPQRSWMYSRAAGGGYLAGSMSHEIDFVLSLFGPPAEVCADVRHSIDQIELPEGGVMPVTADDTSAVLVRMASGALAVFTNSAAGLGASTRLFEVHGADGTIAVHKDDNGTSTTVALVGEEPARLVPSARRLASGATVPQRNSTWAIEAMGLMLEDWLPAFHGGSTCVPTFRDAWQVQRVIEAALESSSGAGWVDLR
jgi:predicted dehydrogenase